MISKTRLGVGVHNIFRQTHLNDSILVVPKSAHIPIHIIHKSPHQQWWIRSAGLGQQLRQCHKYEHFEFIEHFLWNRENREEKTYQTICKRHFVGGSRKVSKRTAWTAGQANRSFPRLFHAPAAPMKSAKAACFEGTIFPSGN